MNKKFKHKLAHNTIEKSEISKLSKWLLKDEKLTMGNKTNLFQKKFSNFLKIKNSIFVNSGSSANLLIAQSLLEANYLKNKVIIAPALSWVTTITPFLQLGYKVELCDTNFRNLGLDLDHLSYLCKKHKPSAIILVHVLGHSNDMTEILKICRKYNIVLIEDTCEAIGSEYKNKKLGTFGLASSFSFYYGHHISTIEGGMTCTNDKKLSRVMTSVRSHGWLRDIDKKFTNKLYQKNNISNFQSNFSFFHSGFNIRSTEINAFLGLSQLKKIRNIVKLRKRNFYRYKKELANFFSVNCKTQNLSNFGYATLVKNREELFNHLNDKGVECRPIISGNIASQPFWKKAYRRKNYLPNADLINDYGIYLPNHANQKNRDIEFICREFKKVAEPLII